MSAIDDLELSVRASNVLRAMNPDMTMDDFMALDRKTVLAQKNAGARTWREVQEVQEGLREVQKRRRRVATGGPAFPILGRGASDALDTLASGMSLRDAAALATLPVLVELAMTRTVRNAPDDITRAQWAASQAFEVADAFIAARETKETD